MNGKRIAIGTGIVGAIAIALYFGYNYIVTQTKLLTKLGYKFVDYKILKFGVSQIVVDVQLELENISDIGVTINGYDVDVSMNGENVVKLKNDKLSQYIAPNGKSHVTLNVSFVPSQVIKQAFNLQNILLSITNPSAIVFGFKGYITAKSTGLFVKNLPIDISLPLSDMLPGAPAQVTKA